MMVVLILAVMMIKYVNMICILNIRPVLSFYLCVDAILTMMVSDDDDARLGTCDVCME